VRKYQAGNGFQVYIDFGSRIPACFRSPKPSSSQVVEILIIDILVSIVSLIADEMTVFGSLKSTIPDTIRKRWHRWGTSEASHTSTAGNPTPGSGEAEAHIYPHGNGDIYPTGPSTFENPTQVKRPSQQDPPLPPLQGYRHGMDDFYMHQQHSYTTVPATATVPSSLGRSSWVLNNPENPIRSDFELPAEPVNAALIGARLAAQRAAGSPSSIGPKVPAKQHINSPVPSNAPARRPVQNGTHGGTPSEFPTATNEIGSSEGRGVQHFHEGSRGQQLEEAKSPPGGRQPIKASPSPGNGGLRQTAPEGLKLDARHIQQNNKGNEWSGYPSYRDHQTSAYQALPEPKTRESSDRTMAIVQQNYSDPKIQGVDDVEITPSEDTAMRQDNFAMVVYSHSPSAATDGAAKRQQAVPVNQLGLIPTGASVAGRGQGPVSRDASDFHTRIEDFLFWHRVSPNAGLDSFSTLLAWTTELRRQRDANFAGLERANAEMMSAKEQERVAQQMLNECRIDLAGKVTESGIYQKQSREAKQKLEEKIQALQSIKVDLEEARRVSNDLKSHKEELSAERERHLKEITGNLEKIQSIEQERRNLQDAAAREAAKLRAENEHQRMEYAENIRTLKSQHNGQLQHLRQEQSQRVEGLETQITQLKSQLTRANKLHREELNKTMAESDHRVKTEVKKAVKEQQDRIEALQGTIVESQDRYYVQISDSSFTQLLESISQQITDLSANVGRPSTHLFDRSLDPTNYLDQNSHERDRNWPRFVRSICWSVILPSFFEFPLGFGCLGSLGEGCERLYHLYLLFSRPGSDGL